MGMSYQTVPRHSPADVIRSSEWNIIADDLDYLNDEVTSLKNQLEELKKTNLVITGLSTINAGESKELAIGCSDVLGETVMPLDGKFSKMKIRCKENTLDADVTITLRKNGADTALSVTLGAGTTTGSGEAEVTFSEGDYFTIYVNATSASSGKIDGLVITLY